jgi:hypothetical protein
MGHMRRAEHDRYSRIRSEVKDFSIPEDEPQIQAMISNTVAQLGEKSITERH